MKTFRYLTIAVLGLVMAACSSDIASEQPVVSHQGKGIPFTATISMRGSATRSVMTESTSTISAAWETGDELALVYEVSGQKQVTKATMTVSDDKSATITATIAEGVITGTTVKLLYPYSAVCNDPAEAATYGTMREDALAGQDGTLETIAKDYDLCQGDGEFTLMSDGTASLKADVTMASQIAIWKLSLSDGTNALKTNQLLIYKDGDSENMLVNAYHDVEAINVFYVAVPAISNAEIDIQAPVDDKTCFYSKKGVTLEAGKFYQSTVTLLDIRLITPLTLEATEDGTTIEVTNGTQKTFQYAKNNGEKTTVEGTDASISLDAGDIVQFYSTNAGLSDSGSSFKILPDKKTYVYGNIMSLIDDGDKGFANDIVIGADYALKYLFYEAANIAFHESKDMILPATTLTKQCYYNMFGSCTGLTRLPEKFLPATTLAEECYGGMFRKCSGLTSLPESLLPATTLTNRCYDNMFISCSGLESLPEKLLPATTLAYLCYNGMFSYCTSLTTVPDNFLPATTLAESCYACMFGFCSSLKEVTCLATDISAQDCLRDWLSGAGTAEGITSRTLHVKSSMTEAAWNLPDTPTWNVIGDQQ
ncbi:MAG: hypothetical protein IKN02_07905 [Prevotella sp.]|nr:hypothetical protein [Prevotella sp.]